MTGDIKAMLEEAAAYIIETCARETTSGNYFIYPGDIPAEILPAGLYSEHLGGIVEIMREYEAIGEVDVSPYDSLDVMVYLDYCPNYEPDADELEDYPDGRKIPDPLTTRRVKENRETDAVATAERKTKPTLMERLEAGRQKAAQQDKSGIDAQKSKKREARE